MSAIEEQVKALNELRAQASKLEDYQRRMRLGAKPGMEVRALWWRRMVFAHGYAEQQVEPLPAGMSQQFYKFVGDRLRAVGEQIRQAESLLAAIPVPESTTHPKGTQ